MDKLSNRLSALAEKRAQAQKSCPADTQHLGDKDCPICGASSSQSCALKSLADSMLAYELVNALPTIISALQKEDL